MPCCSFTTREWTGNSWFYPIEDDSHAIGDFNMIDETRGLVIERDGGQGDAEQACKDGNTENCFKKPATFKRIYMIDMAGVNNGEAVKKVAYIDLMDIKGADGVARQGKREDGRFTFPFVTIENVDRVDENTIIVANDNNFPFSKGRQLDARDDNEMILLEVGEFLKAKAK
ncbi:esterase-like activity of phytase family protein [Leucothrix pacifica]|uniref:esterase-like activity of phytase family protein n=1 Tax=Leucothrix pacifica TaxID=1247513 RepID=UPI001C63DBB1|nr:esterase-like activity of phytase family protein [Leucothrix pacifica]